MRQQGLTVAQVAGRHLGSVSRFREILETQPGLIGLDLPPSVQRGIDQVLEVEIPTQQDLEDLRAGVLDRVTGGVRIDSLASVRSLESVRAIADRLKSIEWLF